MIQMKVTCNKRLISENNYSSIKEGIFAKGIVLISWGSLSPKKIKLSGETLKPRFCEKKFQK